MWSVEISNENEGLRFFIRSSKKEKETCWINSSFCLNLILRWHVFLFLPSPSKRQAFFLPYFQTTEKLIDVRWKQLHLSRQCSLKLNTSIFGRVGAAKFCRASAPKTSFFVWKKIPPMFLWTHPSVRWVTWLNQLQKACSRQPHHLQKVYTLFFGHLLVRKSSCFFIHFP